MSFSLPDHTRYSILQIMRTTKLDVAHLPLHNNGERGSASPPRESGLGVWSPGSKNLNENTMAGAMPRWPPSCSRSCSSARATRAPEVRALHEYYVHDSLKARSPSASRLWPSPAAARPGLMAPRSACNMALCKPRRGASSVVRWAGSATSAPEAERQCLSRRRRRH